MRTHYEKVGSAPYTGLRAQKDAELTVFYSKNAYKYPRRGSKLPEERIMNNNLSNVKRTLRDLLKALPAVKTHCSAEVHKRHLALIAYYQRRYDLLVAAPRASV